MEDFFYAGGLPAVLRKLGEADMLNRDALTVNGATIWENSRGAETCSRSTGGPSVAACRTADISSR